MLKMERDERIPNPHGEHMIMTLNPVLMPVQAKSNFHPLGKKVKSCECRDIQHPQEFKLIQPADSGFNILLDRHIYDVLLFIRDQELFLF